MYSAGLGIFVLGFGFGLGRVGPSWVKAHERNCAQFGKLGYIWALDVYFCILGIWLYSLGLGCGPSLRKGKKAFYPNLDSQCESGARC